MNNHQRGIYQPLVDNIPIYDLSDEDGDEEARSRLPLIIVAGLIGMAAFTGVVWLAYNQGVERGRSGTMVVIPSPEGPARIAPSNAGGEQVLTGLNVYGQPVSPGSEAQRSQLADNTPPITSAPQVLAPREAAPVRLNPPAQPAAPVAQARVEPPKPAAAPPPAVAAKAPTPTAVVAAPAAPVPAPATIPAAVQVAAPASALSGWVLQLGSYPSAEAADGSWTNFKRRFGDVLGPLTNDVQRADLGQKGIFFRLRAGPFADKGEANAACQKLKAEGGNCLVTTP